MLDGKGEVGGWSTAGGEEVTSYPVSAAELLFIKEILVSTPRFFSSHLRPISLSSNILKASDKHLSSLNKRTGTHSYQIYRSLLKKATKQNEILSEIFHFMN